MADITIDDAIFRQKLAQYRQLTGKSWEQIVKDQARLAATRLMQLTYPTDKAQGVKRVAIDVGRVFLANDWFETKFSFRNQRLGDRVKAAVKSADVPVLEKVFANSAKLSRLHIEPFDAAKHKAARTKGRVKYPEPWSFPVGQQQEVKKYREKKQRNVGIAKSGWGACTAILGGRVPQWANRSGNGKVEDNSALPVDPYIIISNNVDFFQSLDAKANIVGRALAGRGDDMLKEAQKSLQNAAKSSGFYP